MKKISFICLYVLALFLTACKKGEDDPAFSLASRKARVEGNWKLQEAALTIGIKDSTGAYSAFIYEIDGSTYSVAHTGNGSRFDGASTLNIAFTKKGVFNMTQELEGMNLEASGAWDFQEGVGKNKSKEKINIHLNTLKGYSNEFGFFNKSMIDFTYTIKELRSKKMVLKSDEEMILLNTSWGIYVTAEYVFVQ